MPNSDWRLSGWTSEAEAMFHADLAALDSIWDEGLLACSTANLYTGKRVLLENMKKGGLRLEAHTRRTVEVVSDGNEAICICTENSEMDGPSGGMSLLCSYMNVWTRRAGCCAPVT
jgi:hypothetical protein